ncbi:MAG: hypothetical protein CL949_09950 [Erythrobacter sp.]|nr:hypothetical protein [Erythrobacter sp.]
MQDAIAIVLFLASIVVAFGVLKPFILQLDRKMHALTAIVLFIAFVIAVPKPTPEEQAEREAADLAAQNTEIRSKADDAAQKLKPIQADDFAGPRKNSTPDELETLTRRERGAFYAAARSSQCDKVSWGFIMIDGPIEKDKWQVDCENDNRFVITIEEAEEASQMLASNTLSETDRPASCTVSTPAECSRSLAQKQANETEVVSFCDITVDKALVSSPDWKWSWDYRFGEDDNLVVTRGFTAQNAYGAELRHEYRCTFDAAKQAITDLKIVGPLGTQDLI